MVNDLKIISGGQTGADQGGLYAARLCGIPTGGTAPKGWRICNYDGLDGSAPELADFGLVEHDSNQYAPRTIKNVEDSDGTVLIGFLDSPGCKLTLSICNEAKKPFLQNPNSEQLREWVKEHNIKVLNVAGNRHSERNPTIFEDTLKLIWNAFADKEPHIGAVYKHWKGRNYVVENLAAMEATGEDAVIYRSIQDRCAWVRPKKEFIQLLYNGSGYIQRFTRVQDQVI